MSIPVRFSHPLFLSLAVLLSGLAWRLVRETLASGSSGRPETRPSPAQRTVLTRRLGWIRLAALTMLVLAASGLEVAGGRAGKAVLFLLDVSASIGEGDRQLALDFLDRSTDQIDATAPVGLVVFGEQAVVERSLQRVPMSAEVRSAPGANGTDLAAALRLANSLVSGDERARLVLLSDGNQTSGDAVREARGLAARGLAIDVLTLGGGAETISREVILSRLTGPERVRLGEPFEIRAEILAGGNAEVLVTLFHEGVAVAERAGTVTGSRRLDLRFPQRVERTGFHTFRAVVEAAQDQHFENNEAGVVVHATGRPQVLYLSELRRGQALRRILADRGFEVDVLEPQRLVELSDRLGRYGAVILDDVPADLLGTANMERLAHFVTDQGGGLIMIGKARAFGPGGYAGTAVEEVLPVDMRVRSRRDRPEAAVVLVVDKSGSMAGREAGVSKLEAAEDAALALVGLLDPGDIFGIIAFDSSAVEVMRPRRLAAVGSSRELLARVQAGGGTRVAPALDRAYAWLSSTTAEHKHIILLSDGQADAEEFGRIRDRVRSGHAALSAVGIGSDVDMGFLNELAEIAGGRAYLANAVDELPQIFAEEARAIAGRWLVNRTFKPRVARAHPVLTGLEIPSAAELHGYVATSPKPSSQLVLVSDLDEPILASWRPGLGKALVLTSDPSSDWMTDLIQWNGFGQLWVQAVRWSALRVDSETLMPNFSVDGGVARLTVDAVGADGRYRGSLVVKALVRSPSGAKLEVALEETAPGRYEASMKLEEAGAHTATISARGDRDDGAEVVHQGFFAAPGSEHRSLGPDRAMLVGLVRLTGGSMLESDRPIRWESTTQTYREASPLLVGLATLLFVCEILLRRRLGLAIR